MAGFDKMSFIISIYMFKNQKFINLLIRVAQLVLAFVAGNSLDGVL